MSEVDETLAETDLPSVATEGGVRRSIKFDLLQSAALTTFARVDFWCFVELMFPVLYPGQQLVYAGYLEAIATLLMRVGQRRYRNVVINLPPRHMKSALASVLYPAWRLGCDPTVKFICISYGDDLAHDLSAQTRKIMRSPLYKQIFPSTVLDKSAVDHIRTTLGGYRYATAVGSDITGFGADEIIIDDPVQLEDALSERVKQQLRDWVNSSVYTRFNDPSKGALVLVMHRLAPDDLSGTIEPYADIVLKLPLIAEELEHYTYQDRTIMRREPREPLNPSRLSVAEIEALKARIAPHVFASQYQQRPATSGTGYCSIERLARYAEAPPFELIVHSWDIASTKGGGDWTVCAKFGLAKDSNAGIFSTLRASSACKWSCRTCARRSSRTTRSISRRSSSWTTTASAGGPTRTSGRGDGGTFCPANLWQARPPTISRSAVSVKAYSASTTAWSASRMRCRGGR
jgi:hypothetical protein